MIRSVRPLYCMIPFVACCYAAYYALERQLKREKSAELGFEGLIRRSPEVYPRFKGLMPK